MYNKYFTMKKSQLKEAIKSEIKSVLLENEGKSAVHSLGKDLYDYLTNTFKMKGGLSSPFKEDTIRKGEQFTVLISDNGGKFDTVTLYIPVGKDNINKEYIQKNIVDQVKRKYKELKTKITQIDQSGSKKAMVDFILTGPNLFQKVTEQGDNPNFDKKIANFAKKINNEMGYQGGVLEAMKQIKSRLERIISKVEGAKRGGADEEPLMKMIGLKEGKKGVIVDPDEIMMHINQYQSGNIDGDDLAQAIEEILVAMMNKSVTFSDIREEDEEPTSADLKKKDSVASISNKLQKLTAKMKKKAKEFKEAEGKAKDKIKDELKDMTAEKKKLEKDL